MAGDFHSDALHVVERYRMTDHDTIQYQATIQDSKVFTKPWTINIALRRRLDRNRLFEYSCESELEEDNWRIHARGPNVVSRQRNSPRRSDGRDFEYGRDIERGAGGGGTESSPDGGWKARSARIL